MAKKKSDCCDDHQHPDYSKEVPRLNRISGQIEGVKRMIGERQYCPLILTQLRAVRAAANSIEASILETHLDACVSDAFNSDDEKAKKQKMAELKELYRKYNE
jgi:CsoR family transcriptional regulator, copper-sensing transcriptional repressor